MSAPSTAEMWADYSGGLTIRKMAEAYGCSFQAVQQRLSAAGYQLRPRSEAGRITALAEEVALDLGGFEGGCSLNDLRDWLGEPDERLLRAVCNLLRNGRAKIIPVTA